MSSDVVFWRIVVCDACNTGRKTTHLARNGIKIENPRASVVRQTEIRIRYPYAEKRVGDTTAVEIDKSSARRKCTQDGVQ